MDEAEIKIDNYLYGNKIKLEDMLDRIQDKENTTEIIESVNENSTKVKIIYDNNPVMELYIGNLDGKYLISSLNIPIEKKDIKEEETIDINGNLFSKLIIEINGKRVKIVYPNPSIILIKSNEINRIENIRSINDTESKLSNIPSPCNHNYLPVSIFYPKYYFTEDKRGYQYSEYTHITIVKSNFFSCFIDLSYIVKELLGTMYPYFNLERIIGNIKLQESNIAAKFS